MTKQEKIQEEYGEYWNKDIDENGWVRLSINTEKKIVNYLINNKELFDSRVETTKDAYYTFFRLKSLQGIENNHGWTKIESESDLPKESGDFYVIHERSINYYPMAEKQLFKKWIGIYTHYQPITKPKPPIY